MSLVVELAEEFVEQVACGSTMAVAVFSTAPVVRAGAQFAAAAKAQIQPAVARRLFLMWR
jgi:hypothetical protein